MKENKEILTVKIKGATRSKLVRDANEHNLTMDSVGDAALGHFVKQPKALRKSEYAKMPVKKFGRPLKK